MERTSENYSLIQLEGMHYLSFFLARQMHASSRRRRTRNERTRNKRTRNERTHFFLLSFAKCMHVARLTSPAHYACSGMSNLSLSLSLSLSGLVTVILLR
jgi:hypothetical protein